MPVPKRCTTSFQAASASSARPSRPRALPLLTRAIETCSRSARASLAPNFRTIWSQAAWASSSCPPSARAIAFTPPPGLARLVIARDNDEDGALAAERLARRCAWLGIAATIVVPAGKDFNDDLVDLGAAALRARLAPLFRCAD
ncbi:MAG: hypothetical protein F4233_14070 [Rhodospirillaceae bacterium]|nr:hypothetical protein [Rhodospirillaceae bacterium]